MDGKTSTSSSRNLFHRVSPNDRAVNDDRATPRAAAAEREYEFDNINILYKTLYRAGEVRRYVHTTAVTFNKTVDLEWFSGSPAHGTRYIIIYVYIYIV